MGAGVLEDLSPEVDLPGRSIARVPDSCGCAESRALRALVARLEAEIDKERAKNRYLRALLFAPSSEKTPASQATSKDSESGATGKSIPPARRKRRRRRGAQNGHAPHGRTIPQGLPVVARLDELPEGECSCPICGLPFLEWGLTEPSYEIDIETRFVCVEKRRRRYRRTCKCPRLPRILTAPGPPHVLARSKFSLRFWVEVILRKYRASIPTARQIAMMDWEGLRVSKGTLTSGIMRLSEFLVPLYDLIGGEIREEFLVHADETRWMNWAKAYSNPTETLEPNISYRQWLWAFISPRYAYYTIDPSRGHGVPERVLGEDPKPYICCDRYSAYQQLRALLSFCWAHVRRDYLKIQIQHPGNPDLCAWAQSWIDLIAKLFELDEQRASDQKGWRARMEGVLSQMEGFIRRPYRDPVKRARAQSMRAHWFGLTMFLEDRRIPLDNSEAERRIRGPAVGRKNYYGAHSDRGARATAIYFSVLETCQINRINPRAFLLRYLEDCARHGGVPKNGEDYRPDRYREIHPEDRLDRPP